MSQVLLSTGRKRKKTPTSYSLQIQNPKLYSLLSFQFSVSFSFTNSFHTFLSQPVYQVVLKARYDRWRREESSSLLRFASTFLLLDCFRQSASGHLYQRESSTLLPTNFRLFSNALKIHFWNTRVRYDLFCTEKHFNLFGRLFFNSFFNLFFNPLLNPNLEP